MVAYEGPVTLLRLDTEAAPQIKHVFRNFERSTGLKDNAATEVLSPALPVEPRRAHVTRFQFGVDQIDKRFVEVLVGHGKDVIPYTLYKLFYLSQNELDWWLRDRQISKHPVEVLFVHELDFVTNDISDQDLAAVPDNGVVLVHCYQ